MCVGKNSCILGIYVLAFVEKEGNSTARPASLLAPVLQEHKQRTSLDQESRKKVIENASSPIFSLGQQNDRMLPPSVCPG